MKMTRSIGTILLLAMIVSLACAGTAFAQEPGRTDPPILTGLWLSAATVKGGESIEVTATASSDNSGVESVAVSFYNNSAEEALYCPLSAASDGKFHGTLTVDQYLSGGIYTIDDVYVKDNEGCSTDYSNYAKSYTPYQFYGPEYRALLPSFASSLSLTVNAGRWVRSGNYWYYADNDGNYLSDTTAEIGGNTYAFRADGSMITGWGQTSDSSWYYCNSSGVMQTGWLKYGGSWYYLDETGMAADEWVNGYYLRPDGTMATGWYRDTEGNWYLFNSSGRMLTGWQKSGGSWYYLDENLSGTIGTGVMASDTWADGCYLKPDGAMATGWYQDAEGNWYLFNSSGKQLTGWQKSGGSWYYLDENLGGTIGTGVMVSDTVIEIDGLLSSFDASGAWTGYV